MNVTYEMITTCLTSSSSGKAPQKPKRQVNSISNVHKSAIMQPIIMTDGKMTKWKSRIAFIYPCSQAPINSWEILFISETSSHAPKMMRSYHDITTVDANRIKIAHRHSQNMTKKTFHI